jgi:hypothetical protein
LFGNGLNDRTFKRRIISEVRPPKVHRFPEPGLGVADYARRAAMLISASVEQKGMSENYITCVSSNFVKVSQGLAESFLK